MSNTDKSLVQRIKNGESSNTAEHLLNILKAGLATTPFCGGIASLLTDYIPSSKHMRLEKFVTQIAVDLDTLQHRVDESLILTDEFAYLMENCLRGVAENYQKEKLEMFRGILINSITGFHLEEYEKEYFLSLVNTLSVLHIRILKFMANSNQYLKENGISEEKIVGGFSNFFPVAIPGVSLDIIKSAFNDLYQNGFINTDKSIFGTMTAAQGLQLLGNRVSDLGTQFINFCTIPK